MRSSILVTVLVLFCFVAYSQESEPVKTKNNGHHLGGYVGASSGYGLSYRYFRNIIGIQITTTPIVGSDNSNISVGGMLLFSLNKTNYTNLYGYVSHHQHYAMNESSDEYSDYYYKHESWFSATGGGVGFELNVGDRVGFNWNLGYAYYNSKDEYSDNDDQKDWRTFIDGGTGIFYKF